MVQWSNLLWMVPNGSFAKVRWMWSSQSGTDVAVPQGAWLPLGRQRGVIAPFFFFLIGSLLRHHSGAEHDNENTVF